MSKTLHEAVLSKIEEISERVRNGGVRFVGIPSGFPVLDDQLSGFRKDALYVFGARPGMGKTALALTMAFNIASTKKRVLFLSLEMAAELLALRTLSMMTDIPSSKIELGQLTADEFARVQQVVEVTEHLDFRIVDESMDSEEFVGKVQKYKEKFGLDILFVDYVSLFRDPNRFGENDRVSRISNNLRAIARLCDIPVVALVQLNREVEKRENHVPILSDIRDTGAIEQDAFMVGFLFRPHYYAMLFDGEEEVDVEKDAKIIIAKNRQGEQGIRLGLDFYPKQTVWKAKEAAQPRRMT